VVLRPSRQLISRIIECSFPIFYPVVSLLEQNCSYECRLEAAVQRLISLCSVLNEMEPLRVLNHMFIPQEVHVYADMGGMIYVVQRNSLDT
jgi:hypothetical protein